MKISVEQFDKDTRDIYSSDDYLLRDFIIEMKRILASGVAEHTQCLNNIRDNIDLKFYPDDIRNAVEKILDLFDKWVVKPYY